VATFFAYFQSAPDVAMAIPGTLPRIYITRSGDSTLVVNGSPMTNLGRGHYRFDFAPADGQEYAVDVDGDPLAAGQTITGQRFAVGSISGTTEARIETDIPAMLLLMTTTGVVLTGPAITAIWNEDVTGREASPNSAARIQDMTNKLMRGRIRTNPTEGRLELYDPVDDTLLLAWDLTDFGGNPISNVVGAPFDRIKATET
jgi:hypothetical protein